MDTIFSPYLIVVIFTFFFMTAMWVWGKTRNNYAVIDVGWGLVIAGIFSILVFSSHSSLTAKFFILLPVLIWSFRLSGFLYWTRIRTNHPEDKRYADFRKDYGEKVHRKFFTNVFMLQGILALLLSAPAISADNWNLNLNGDLKELILPSLGWFLVAFGILGETLADHQLHSFVNQTNNKGKVCDIGLWKYSRHPNYFFEWVIWLGIGVIPLRDLPSSISLFSPLLMFVLLRFVSGVPFAERFSLKSKGELFKTYQNSTNAFFPWFPKSKTN